MPFRMTKVLERSQDGFFVRISPDEVDAMGLAAGQPVDIEVWPGSEHLERIPM